jgi:hypothetical protein
MRLVPPNYHHRYSLLRNAGLYFALTFGMTLILAMAGSNQFIFRIANTSSIRISLIHSLIRVLLSCSFGMCRIV